MIFDRWSRNGPVDDAGDDLDGDLDDGNGADAPAMTGSVSAPVEEPSPVAHPAPGGGEDLGAADGDDAGGGVDVADGDVDDVDAFLAGRLVQHWSARGRSVPAWAVVNELAHADLDELVALARPGAPAPAADVSGAKEPAWRAAQRALAVDLLDGAGGPEQLARLQRDALVPLELWLIGRSETETVSWRRAIEAAELVVDALRR